MIHSVDDLEQQLSEPNEAVIESLSRLEGDLILLGVGGKMGPSLARMAVRASREAGVVRRVIGVSRFSDRDLQEKLQGWGVETIAGGLFDSDFMHSLPNVANIVFMAGRKFGTEGGEAETWAANTYLPAIVCQKFPKSRIAAFSTGNVYGPVPTNRPPTESSSLNPVGEYAMSCLGRERMFEYFSRSQGIRLSLLRLNYAADLRYGVLVDLAQTVFQQRPVSLEVPCASTIWQGDANAMSLCALAHASSPPFVVNIAGPEQFYIKDLAKQFGKLMNKPVRFSGTEGTKALLNDGSLGHERYGLPRIKLEKLVHWVADWIMRGEPCHGKPTHYEVSDGKF